MKCKWEIRFWSKSARRVILRVKARSEITFVVMAMERFGAFFFLHKVMYPTGSSFHYICFFAESAGSLFLSKNWWNIKQLLDEVLITETLIIRVSQKPNIIMVLLYIVYTRNTVWHALCVQPTDYSLIC